LIELTMVKRMIKRGLLLAPVVIAMLAVFGGLEWALSAAIGMALSIFNLWLAARLIGGMAENKPELIPAAGFAAFILALALLVVAALVIKQIESLDFPVTGLVLIGAHLTLVTWEAANAFLRLPAESETGAAAEARTRS
jgi:hypothetical protein